MDKKYIWVVRAILDYVDLHFMEDIGIEDIAKSVKYSPRHCNRVCLRDILLLLLLIVQLRVSLRSVNLPASVTTVR